MHDSSLQVNIVFTSNFHWKFTYIMVVLALVQDFTIL